MAKVLPTQPSLENYKKQAKSLLKSHDSGNPSACATLRLLRRFSNSSDKEILDSSICLAEAQYSLALEYGFASWNALKEAILKAPDSASSQALGADPADQASRRNIVSGNAHSIESIIKGTETYFRTFALADCMDHHEGDIEWIAPKPGGAGPSVVFKASFRGADAAAEGIERLIPDLNSGRIPRLWVLSPLTDPALFGVLLSKGFTGGSASGEWGMAMELDALAGSPAPNDVVKVARVTTPADLTVWINVVNAALHGWEMLTTEHYSVWLEHEELSFYLGYIDGVPVSTVATIRNGDSAGLEFVSTLKEYEGRGAAYAVCLRALQDLQARKVQTATLAAFDNAVGLYEKLGFRKYYEQVMYSFQRAGRREN